MLAVISILLFYGHFVNSFDVTSWVLTNENGSIVIKNVPSPVDVYSALYQNHFIDWPLKGYNDVSYRWIAYDNWTFTSYPFYVPPSVQVSLSISNLDIYPLITLNNNILNITTSEFSSSEILISSDILNSLNNILQIKFTSPPIIAKLRSSAYEHKILPNCWPKEFNGECHINFLRKTQSSFGWDWGPAIPSMGILGKVGINYMNKTLVFIKGVRFLTKSNESCQQWKAEIFIKLKIIKSKIYSVICVTIKMEDLQVYRTQCFNANYFNRTAIDFAFEVNSQTLKLWWPYEMGTPTAYKLEVLVTCGSLIMDSSIKYVGFKKIELDQSLISETHGRNFQFIINCKSFFIKGTNWVPRSYLSIDWKNESYLEFLLSSVKNANINTIRLWGGGRIEIESFYSITDRLGIMVWHDLMFAGSLYPYDTNFYKEVNDEVSELLWNIQSHPSILVWAGNNEVELLIAQGWYKAPMNHFDISHYYNTFSLLVKPLVKGLDPFTPFVLSSPSNGVESERTQGVSKNPQSVYYGDVHYYLYSGNLWDERSYPITRMTTEFGFQSFPSTNAWATIINTSEDFNPNGLLMKHRQHHSKGYEQIESALFQYFGKMEPPKNNTFKTKYTWFSYLSQINQAMILKVHINRLRSNQCNISKTGEGFTSGAMFWQLNDNWIAPSWSTIESYGQWKLAHYYVKHAFSRERIILVIQENTIIVRFITHNSNSPLKYDIILSCVDITQNVSFSKTCQKNISINTNSNECNVITAIKMKVSEFLQQCHCNNINKCIATATLLKETNIVSYDEALFVKPKELKLPEESITEIIKVKVEKSVSDFSVCIITLKQNYVHLFVTLTTTTLGTFDNNGFHLWKENYDVIFYPWYYHKSEFFDCSKLHVEVITLNLLLS